MNFKTVLAALALLSLPAFAAEDTQANRVKAADRYLLAMPISELMNDMIEEMGKTQPPEKKAWIRHVMVNCLDQKALESIIKDAMVKVFTADELGALADFYASTFGKSAMKKFAQYMALATPGMQAEVMKAIEKSKVMTEAPR